MKVKQKINYQTLSSSLKSILKDEREKRNFKIKEYIYKKAERLNKYMLECNLNACVIAVSGGLDSSVTLGIVSLAKSLPKSPISKIQAISIPCNTDGATNQESAYDKAKAVAEHFGVGINRIDISNSVLNFTKNIEIDSELKSDQWSRGQAVSYFRTSSIYYITSLLTANNYRSVVIGTTNRDEGAYIGYFGKASDGMVDVQLISDAHKSELRDIANYFKIPNKIITDSPTGDMYDGRLDEEVFGTPYDFVELYTYYLEKTKTQKLEMKKNIKNLNCEEEFYLMSENIENMHKYNGHKYLGASPAIHLDLIPSNFEGGWKYNVYKGNEIACQSPTTGDHKTW